MRAILVVVALLITQPVHARQILLASGGKTLAHIVCDSHHPVVKQAVADLSLYLGKVTGADFSKSSGFVEIKVLDSIPSDAPEKLRHAPEGYWIDAHGNTIRIVGGSPIGAAYGVYHFLEKYAGVRWFLPAPDGEYVPSNPNLTIPAFKMRWVGTGTWALRNGGNHPSVGEGSYRFEPGIYHTQERFLPVGEYFAKDPEYYALLKGERRLSEKSTKLCTSNPDVIREVGGNMARYLDEHPGVEVISLSPTDGLGFCECDACRALDEGSADPSQQMSRRMTLFYNAVAAELNRICWGGSCTPAPHLAVGVYSRYTWPPEDKSLNLLPNMDVILCHYVPACLAHPVNDPRCPANKDYNAILRGWLDRSSGVYFYEYYWKNNWFGLPWPVVHTIAADIPYFHRIGVKGVFSQFTEGNAYTLGLNYYIAAKLLWNPQANVRGLVDEYYEKYFAESAAPMRDYHEMLEQRMESVKADIPGAAGTNGTKVYDPLFLEQLVAKLDEAMSLAKTDVTRKRIERHQKHLDYSRRLIRALETKDEGNVFEAHRLLTAFIEDYQKDPAAWDGLVSPTDAVRFLNTEVNALQGKLPK